MDIQEFVVGEVDEQKLVTNVIWFDKAQFEAGDLDRFTCLPVDDMEPVNEMSAVWLIKWFAFDEC